MSQYPGGLHNHTEFSNLRLRDSINRHEEMIDYALELGHEVIAFTEHDTVANVIKIQKTYKKVKEKNPDFKVILGNEIYLCRDGMNLSNFEKGKDDYYHFILLAKNAEGHKQIRELSSRAWARSYKTGKMTRVPSYYQDLLEVIKSNRGNVIGTTACLGGFLGSKLLEWRRLEYDNEFYEKIVNWLLLIQDIFGKEDFYLEMQPSTNDEQIFVNKEIIKLSKKLDIPYIITTDAHYLKKEDAPIHEAYLKSQDGDREVASFYESTYLMETKELESYMSYFDKDILNKAYENIIKIKNKCEDYNLTKPLHIPSVHNQSPKYKNCPLSNLPWLEKFFASEFEDDRIMASKIWEKIENDDRLRSEESYTELEDNLRIIWESSEVNKTHWSSYFLNLKDILQTCWDSGTLVGPGRGSGVGFYVLYLLDIIQINPLWETTRTFSWRFLNPARVSVLDIDTDIEGGRRSSTLQALREKYGSDRVANVITFGTEGSKSAIQTAARGLGIDVDVSLYISSLIPADRGLVRTLSQCYYGDEENGFAPIPLFVAAMKEYPELWKVAQRIEGLVCRVGEHAGGVIFVDEPFINSTALMKAPNGDTITQFDLHDCEACSLIKIDLLSVEALDKIHICLDLLLEAGYITPEATLKETYEKYIGIYNLERENQDMWKMVWEHKIQALFQMEKQSGIQGIALTKPKSVDDLAVLNSVIRLMAQEKDAEQPLVKYARFKNDIRYWYQEMNQYGLGDNERKLLEPIVGLAYGICESQEKFMQLVQMPECGGFDLMWADRLRKSIAKKNPAEYDALTKEYFENAKQKQLNKNLCNYVWNVLVATSRGYGFNASHTLAYSLVALQEMNLASRFPIIFWNCACLIADSGGAEEEQLDEEIVDIYEPEDFEEFEYEDAPDKKTKTKKKRSNNYDKIATAIGKMRKAGVIISPPDINKSSYTFYPDVEKNQIFYGLRGILNVGDEIINNTIANRPYISPRDYLNRVKPNKQAMISLIKGGAFDNLMERKLCMAWYINETCDKKQRLTLQNLPSLIKYDLIPNQTEKQIMARRVYEFNRYLKAMCKVNNETYKADERAINFLVELDANNLIESDYLISAKKWDKIYQKWMDIFREWIVENKENILTTLNDIIFKEDWDKYAKGNFSSWEMESLSFYYHEHELEKVYKEKYGFADFEQLSPEPIVDKTFYKNGKEIKMFKLSKICGTCIAKDKAKATVTLLTTTGVVNVKFRKEYYAMFDKQISERQEDGTKKVKERSWFNRGQMIVVSGMRSEDNFVAKKYASTGGHTLYRIAEILPDGDIILQSERYKGEEEEDNG